MYSYPHKTAYGPVEDAKLQSLMDGSLCPDLYFHIPFCRQKCGYCNLFSVSGADTPYMARYVDALAAQFAQFNLSAKTFRSFTVGGGSPLLLPEAQLVRLFSLVEPGLARPVQDRCQKSAAGSGHVAESNPEDLRRPVTGVCGEDYMGHPNAAADHLAQNCVETSPGDVVAEKLDILKDFRIERVSLGVQSLHADELARIGRADRPDVARAALERIKRRDFPCLNVDLIYGIPGQGAESLSWTLRRVLDYEPDEIFLYPLYIRAGTGIAGTKPNPSRYALYCFARDFLAERGYRQLSMRQFAKRLPEHPQSCGFDDMVGLGCGARSYLGNLHFCTPFAVRREHCRSLIDAYMETPVPKTVHGYLLDEDEQKRRYVLKNLLYFHGLSRSGYRRRFNSDPMADFPVLLELRERGYLTKTPVDERPETVNPPRLDRGPDGKGSRWVPASERAEPEKRTDMRLRLTPLGMSLSDMIGPLFVSENVRARMDAWQPQ
jgi:oxygen-independent coproporphyrinogen-3 oxidase